jgi:hypothetical protein
MNWQAVGAMGEILGAFAVLITLGYLAAQVRQNTQAMKRSALSSVRDIYQLTENNERYIAALMKSQRNEELTPEDRAHMVERFMTIMRGLEGMWVQHQLGALSLTQVEQHLELLRWALSMPEARRMWVHVAHAFDPQFCTVVDRQVLAENAPISGMTKAFMALDPEWQDQS